MWDVNLTLALAFVAVASIVLWLGSWLFPGQALTRRVQDFSDDEGEGDRQDSANRQTSVGVFVGSGLRRLGAKLLPDNQSQRTQLQTRLMHAGLYSPAALPIYLATKVLLMVVPLLLGGLGGLLGLVDVRLGLYCGAIGGGICGILPSFYLDRRKSKRQVLLRRGLPDFLDLLVSCVESGLSLQGAVQRVTDELMLAHRLLAHEMSILQREVSLGSPLHSALRHLGQRTDLESIRSLATVVQQSQRFGSSVTGALRVQADMLRTQRELRAEEMANKAAVKILFPTLLFIFPAIFVVLAAPAAIQVQEKFGKSAPGAKQYLRK